MSEATEALQPAKTFRPPEAPGPVMWLRRNLFSSWFNGLLTILSLAVLYFFLKSVLTWVFFAADWRPISANPLLFIVGQYPRDQLWRVGASLLLVSFLSGVSWGVWGGIIRSFAITLAIVLGAAALLPGDGQMGTMGFRAFLIANPVLIYLGHLFGRRSFMSGRIALAGWLIVSLVSPLLLRGFG